jgi:hypothetical protein
MQVYHFTDTARLPFILKSGVLKPGRNKLGGFPDPDFLWATSQDVGDYTACGSQAYRQGKTRLVRFALNREDFKPWREIVKDYPQWTPFQIERLERAARGRSNPSDWFCRSGPILSREWLAIDTRDYHGKWQSFSDRCVTEIDDDPETLSITIGRKIHVSKQIELLGGNLAYSFATAEILNLDAGGMQ